jgi:hypothetical protein
MEPIEVSETSAQQKRTSGIYPKEHLQHSKPDESLKSRKLSMFYAVVLLTVEDNKGQQQQLLHILVVVVYCLIIGIVN